MTLTSLIEPLLSLGVSRQPDPLVQQRIRTTNLLSVVSMFLSLVFLAYCYLSWDWLNAPALTVIMAGCILYPTLNALGFSVAARMAFAILPPAAMGWASLNYLSPIGIRVLQFSILAFPLMLFTRKEQKLLTIALLTNVVLFFLPGMYDFFREVKPTASEGTLLQALLETSGCVLAVTSLIFLQKQYNDSAVENEKLLTTAREQNSLMKISEARLKKQMVQIEKSTAELQASAATVEASRREMEVKNNALETSQEELRRTMELIENRRRERERMADFERLLRWQPGQSLERWGSSLLGSIAPDYKMLQGALYQVAETPLEGQHLALVAGFALHKDTPKQIRMGQGLAGQVAKSARPWYIDNPNQLKSMAAAGLVAIAPKANFMVPLIHNDRVEGLLEISTLHPLSEADRNLLQRMGEQLGGALASVASQRRIQQLYEEANEKSRILEVQEEELRQNISQLETAQEQMRLFQQQLEDANDQLEARVDERTAELANALNGLQSAQQQLVLSEKMAALGQLVAGVAHEMNSPLGAIKASAVNMIDLLPAALNRLPELLASVSEEKRAMVYQFIEVILYQEREHLSSKEERKLRRQFAETLGEAGIQEEAEDMARRIVDAGFYGDLTPYLSIFADPQGTPFSELFYSLGQLKMNLDNISLAADKTKKVVFALKSYAHTQDKQELAPINLREHIETVLIIYNNQLKYGIEVEAKYDDSLPMIPAYADELSQVWTNIIQNAIQAMNGVGKLAIEVERVGEFAEVHITDSGSGIPADKIEKIFEPFFTTKPRGEGTGLGLDICRKIVRKHHGDMRVESQPGRTRFTVSLPIVQPATEVVAEQQAA